MAQFDKEYVRMPWGMVYLPHGLGCTEFSNCFECPYPNCIEHEMKYHKKSLEHKLHCESCGFNWKSSLAHPQRCPNCKTNYWSLRHNIGVQI